MGAKSVTCYLHAHDIAGDPIMLTCINAEVTSDEFDSPQLA